MKTEILTRQENLPRRRLQAIWLLVLFGLWLKPSHFRDQFMATGVVVSAFAVTPTLGDEHRVNSRSRKMAMRRPVHPRTDYGASKQSEHDSGCRSGKGVLEVVLFGVGDLRVDDHLGLNNAIESGNPTLPICILNSSALSNTPGGVAHTVDTARLLAAALMDLDGELRATLGASLHVKIVTLSSLEDILLEIRDSMNAERIRIHACDLGDIDNSLAYGSLSQLVNLPITGGLDFFEVVSWNSNLRDGPWKDVKNLPVEYPAYEMKHVARGYPIYPTVVDKRNVQNYRTRFVSLEQFKTIPTAEELLSCFVSTLQPDLLRCVNEQNTGLFGTHWGGLQSSTVGCRAVIKALEAYAIECGENDQKWSKHRFFPLRNCCRNERSLEHASMVWQLRGVGTLHSINPDKWLAGEVIVRYLAAPLLLGTVSPRRIWHTSHSYRGGQSPSPLKNIVEAREWHRLLAAHNNRSDPSYQELTDGLAGRPAYRYWRYQGFLCRYAVFDVAKPSEDEKSPEGILLVHGFGASASHWNRLVIEYEKGAGGGICQAIAPDLIGFGQSEKPALSYTGYMWDSMVTDFCKEQVLPKYKWKSLVIAGNSIGGAISMSFAASDAACVSSLELSSCGAPGSGLCNGLILLNSAGPVLTSAEVETKRASAIGLRHASVAQMTALGALPPFRPPPRALTRCFANLVLVFLRRRIRPALKWIYPSNPSAVDGALCNAIYRDSLDPGVINIIIQVESNVMFEGARLPLPRTANELLEADFGCASTSPATDDDLSSSESTFSGPVLVAQGILDPLHDAADRMERFGQLRQRITVNPINAGHCPHDERPMETAASIAAWICKTRAERHSRMMVSYS